MQINNFIIHLLSLLCLLIFALSGCAQGGPEDLDDLLAEIEKVAPNVVPPGFTIPAPVVFANPTCDNSAEVDTSEGSDEEVDGEEEEEEEDFDIYDIFDLLEVGTTFNTNTCGGSILWAHEATSNYWSAENAIQTHCRNSFEETLCNNAVDNCLFYYDQVNAAEYNINTICQK